MSGPNLTFIYSNKSNSLLLMDAVLIQRIGWYEPEQFSWPSFTNS